MSDLQTLREDIIEIKAVVSRIESSLNGNGTPGIKTRVALLERWRDSASKLIWIVLGCSISALFSAGVLLVKAVISGVAPC